MATATAIHNSRAAAQNGQFFRFAVSFGNRKTGAFTAESGLEALAAQYQPNVASSQATAMFQQEMPDVDLLLLLGDYPTVRKGQRCILSWPSGSPKREFEVIDAAPGDSGPTRTMVAIQTPKSGNN